MLYHEVAMPSSSSNQIPVATSDFIDEFHRLLGRLVHAHARFDFNIGLQLNWLGPHCGVDIGHLLAAKIPFAQRLQALKPLVLDMYQDAGGAALAEFTAWFEKAEKLKALRNDYVHGRWGTPGRVVNHQPMLTFVPLDWNMNPDRPDNSLQLGLKEFASQVESVEALMGQYAALEKRYIRYVKAAV